MVGVFLGFLLLLFLFTITSRLAAFIVKRCHSRCCPHYKVVVDFCIFACVPHPELLSLFAFD